MMSADQYRTKAKQALSAANTMANPQTRAVLEETADKWIRLAIMAEAQDHLIRSAGLSKDPEQ